MEHPEDPRALSGGASAGGVVGALSFAASAIVGILLVVGIMTFAAPCIHDDGSVSACFGASRVLMGAGVLAAVTAIVGVASRTKVLGAISGVIACAVGIACALVPGTVMPLCMMQTMRCWTAMRPFAIACGALLVVCGIAQVVSLARQANRSGRG